MLLARAKRIASRKQHIISAIFQACVAKDAQRDGQSSEEDRESDAKDAESSEEDREFDAKDAESSEEDRESDAYLDVHFEVTRRVKFTQ